MKNYLILIVLMALPLFTQAQTYRKSVGNFETRLHSKEGLNISLTTQKFESGDVGDSDIFTAEQIQIIVSGANINFATRAVRAILIPNCISGQFAWPVNKPLLSEDLMPVTDGTSLDFVGNFQGSLTIHQAIHGGEWINCQPQLAVVVDGVWQTDPINGTHNFSLDY